MWTKMDNGSDVTWQQAKDYCLNLSLDGHSDWRLPEINELLGIYDTGANVNGWHVKGNLKITGWIWSRTAGSASGEALAYYFNYGEAFSYRLNDSDYARALCVRRPEE